MSLVLILTEDRFREELEDIVSHTGFEVADFSGGDQALVDAVPTLLASVPDLALVVSESCHPTWGRSLDERNVRYWLVQVGHPSGQDLRPPIREPHRHLLGLDGGSKGYLSQLLDDWRERPLVRVDCFTFAYRDGLPPEADWVLDTRFLDSPYWIPEMRARTGRDPMVRRHMMDQPGARRLVEGYLGILTELLDLYQAQRRSVLRVAVGCTGGKHRSVAIASEIVERINRSGQATSRFLDRPPLHLPQALD
ncbi:MAG: RapZ C-terminal domain-containing protein [Candidatus Dormibacteria bacterium]